MNDVDERIKNNLVAAIKESGLPQTIIANKACISNATLSDYIHKNKMPSLSTFARLCVILDVSSDEILGLVKG